MSRLLYSKLTCVRAAAAELKATVWAWIRLLLLLLLQAQTTYLARPNFCDQVGREQLESRLWDRGRWSHFCIRRIAF